MSIYIDKYPQSKSALQVSSTVFKDEDKDDDY